MALREIPDGIGWIGGKRIRSCLDPEAVRRADELAADLKALPDPNRDRLVYLIGGYEDFEERRERLWREAQAEKRAALKSRADEAKRDVLRDLYARLSDGRLLAFGYANEIRMGEPRRAVPADYWTTPDRPGLWIKDFDLDTAERADLKVFGLRFLTADEAATLINGSQPDLYPQPDGLASAASLDAVVSVYWFWPHRAQHGSLEDEVRWLMATPPFSEAIKRLNRKNPPEALRKALRARRSGEQMPSNVLKLGPRG